MLRVGIGVCADCHLVACPAQTNPGTQSGYSGTNDDNFHFCRPLGTDTGFTRVYVDPKAPNTPRRAGPDIGESLLLGYSMVNTVLQCSRLLSSRYAFVLNHATVF